MLAALLNAAIWLLDKLFGKPAESPDEKAGAADQQVTDMVSADGTAVSAGKATDATGAAISSPDGLSKYEASDPNNRDKR